MRAFTHDVESVELTADECTVFAQIVIESCHRQVYRGVSQTLASVTRPWHEMTINSLQRQVELMWKTGARL
jgi:hypothetical protein